MWICAKTDGRVAGWQREGRERVRRREKERDEKIEAAGTQEGQTERESAAGVGRG